MACQSEAIPCKAWTNLHNLTWELRLFLASGVPALLTRVMECTGFGIRAGMKCIVGGLIRWRKRRGKGWICLERVLGFSWGCFTTCFLLRIEALLSAESLLPVVPFFHFWDKVRISRQTYLVLLIGYKKPTLGQYDRQVFGICTCIFRDERIPCMVASANLVSVISLL